MPRRITGVALFGVLTVGCFTLQPTKGSIPPAGTEVAFDLNDAGRVALGTSMGPEVAQIEGRLIGTEDGTYVVAVSTVRTLSGGVQVWRGEQVRIKSEYIGPAYIRRFDTARSLAVGGTVIGGFAAFLVTRALRGAGGGDGRNRPDTALTHRGKP